MSTMTTPATPTTSQSIYNVPNLLTSIRFVLAIAVVILVAYESYWFALVSFSIAASTDWMDGYWARKYNQVTKLGRIFDPFVDKIIICGSFIALVAVPNSGIAPWMVIIVVGRELLVTSLRGMIEGKGGDFSARWLGKWKMVLQCAAVIAVLICLAMHTAAPWFLTLTTIIIWSSIALTIHSGIDYVIVASKVMREDDPAA